MQCKNNWRKYVAAGQTGNLQIDWIHYELKSFQPATRPVHKRNNTLILLSVIS